MPPRSRLIWKNQAPCSANALPMRATVHRHARPDPIPGPAARIEEPALAVGETADRVFLAWQVLKDEPGRRVGEQAHQRGAIRRASHALGALAAIRLDDHREAIDLIRMLMEPGGGDDLPQMVERGRFRTGDPAGLERGGHHLGGERRRVFRQRQQRIVMGGEDVGDATVADHALQGRHPVGRVHRRDEVVAGEGEGRVIRHIRSRGAQLDFLAPCQRLAQFQGDFGGPGENQHAPANVGVGMQILRGHGDTGAASRRTHDAGMGPSSQRRIGCTTPGSRPIHALLRWDRSTTEKEARLSWL